MGKGRSHPISLVHFQPVELTAVYEFIKEQAAQFSVHELCRTLRVSRSSYYEWASGHTHQPDRELAVRVVEVFWRHARRYGSRRIRAELAAEGLAVGRDQVRRVMRAEGLRAIQPRRARAADNRFTAWTADQSELVTRESAGDETERSSGW